MKLTITWTDDRTSTAYVSEEDMPEAVRRIISTRGVVAVTSLDDTVELDAAMADDDLMKVAEMRPSYFN